MKDERPLVAHVMHRFDVGGLENGVVNLINGLPADRFRHAVVALTEVTSFRERVRRNDVTFVELRKAPGHLVASYPRLRRIFCELAPDIVHTRNLAALEAVVPAWAAGVPVRIHGEHGWDVGDVDGSSRKYRLVRMLYRPFVSHYLAVSRDLERYLLEGVRVPRERITQLYNGVDTASFMPDAHQAIEGCPFDPSRTWIVGTVGRMQAIKDQVNLARAFVRALALAPELRATLRLVMIGEGPLRARAQEVLAEAGAGDLAWLPGQRDDVAWVLRGLHCFVLPSLAEGISNTILEAMATGIPVIATRVGGNPELVEDGRTGTLVPSADADALARAIIGLARDPSRAGAFGRAGRARVEARFSLAGMLDGYARLYDRLSAASSRPERAVGGAAAHSLPDR